MYQSYQLSDYYTRHILTHDAWTVEEQLREVPGGFYLSTVEFNR